MRGDNSSVDSLLTELGDLCRRAETLHTLYRELNDTVDRVVHILTAYVN